VTGNRTSVFFNDSSAIGDNGCGEAYYNALFTMAFAIDIDTLLTPKSPLSRRGTIWISGRF